MEQENLETLEEFKEVATIRSYLWSCGINNGLEFVFFAYLAKENNINFESISDILPYVKSQDLKDIFSTNKTDIEMLCKVVNYLQSFPVESLKKTILIGVAHDKGMPIINYPSSYINLAEKFIDSENKNSILDVYSRDISFLLGRTAFQGYKKITTFDKEFSVWIEKKIKAEVADIPIDFGLGEFFNSDCPKFDTALLFFNSRELEENEINQFLKEHPYIEKAKTSECFNLVKVMETLNENGEALAFVSAGFITNQRSGDISCRKFLCENKFVKTVITLPENTISNVGIRIALLVLTKKTNDSIRFIDATEECRKTKVTNIITRENINNIFEASCHDTDISKLVDYRYIDETYSLNPGYYLSKREVEFEGVEENIEIGNSAEVIRGCNAIQKELDNRYSISETNNRILSASWDYERTMPSINQLKSLKEIKENEQKYCLQEGDFVISKMGYPKFDIAQNLGKNKVIVSGNLYIVRFDKTILHPKYVKCFFESCEGYNLLENALTGSLTLTLSVEMLKKIKIPLIPMERQLEIVKEYEFLEFMKRDCFEKIQKIDWKLESLFGEALNGKVKYYWTDDGDIVL